MMIAGTCWEGNTSGLGSNPQVMTSTGKCCWICSSVMFRENLPHIGLGLSMLNFFHLFHMDTDWEIFGISLKVKLLWAMPIGRYPDMQAGPAIWIPGF
jgi:hypothetical protein